MRRHNWITIGLTLLIALMIAVSCEKPQNEPGTPEVESDSIVIRDSSVICYGTVLSDGGDSIRERGICWYGEPYPTSISDHTPPVISDHRMVAGGDLGSFSRTLNHYGSDSIYYFRAYARNDVGVSYGSEMGFRCIYDPNLDDPGDDEPTTPAPILLEDLPAVTISPVPQRQLFLSPQSSQSLLSLSWLFKVITTTKHKFYSSSFFYSLFITLISLSSSLDIISEC